MKPVLLVQIPSGKNENGGRSRSLAPYPAVASIEWDSVSDSATPDEAGCGFEKYVRFVHLNMIQRLVRILAPSIQKS